jgi:hypothetical protein
MLRKIHFEQKQCGDAISATPYHTEISLKYFAICGQILFFVSIIAFKRVAMAQYPIISFSKALSSSKAIGD